MIRVENGRQPYTDAQIDAALVRAGVMPSQRSLQQTRTVKGGQVAAAGTMGGIGAIKKAGGQLAGVTAGNLHLLQHAGAGADDPSGRQDRPRRPDHLHLQRADDRAL